MQQHPTTPQSRKSKRVLHVGCGPHGTKKLHETFKDGTWQEVRLDINPNANPDIVASITDMHVIPSGSFDALYSSHNLEHLLPHELPKALCEFCRVLRPEGFALITLPDLRQICEVIAAGNENAILFTTDKGPITALDMIYGFRPLLETNPFMAHRFGYTAETLATALDEAGFAHISVERDGEFNLWAVASPTPLTKDTHEY